MLKVKIYSPQTPQEQRTLELVPEKMTEHVCMIGRSSNCGIVLNSPDVSRLHGKIEVKMGEYYFTDLASKDGSRLNNQVVPANQPTALKSGDILRISDFILEIEAIAVISEEAATVIDPKRTIISPPLPVALVPSQYMPVALVDPTQITRWTKGELAVKCIQITDETADVKTFSFVTDPPTLFSYKPGQFLTLDLEINGEQVLRSYSISSTPSRPHTLEITVKRVPAPDHEPNIPRGLVSNWLHDNLKVGSNLKLSGPLGKFTCFVNPSQKLLLISAGSGITPMMSMSRWVYDTASDCNIVFLHSARSKQDIIFHRELELMAGRMQNFHLAITATRPEAGQNWLGLRGRITESMLEMVAADFRDRTVYVCGPDSFMQATKKLLESIKFPMQNYYEESFGGAKKSKKVSPANQIASQPAEEPLAPTPKAFGIGAFLENLLPQSPAQPAAIANPIMPAAAPVAAAAATKIAVSFAKAGKEVPCDGEESVLEIADQAGVKIRSSCRVGSCGTCKKLKLEGNVKMEGFDPEALEPSEQAAGFILTCVSFPRDRVVMDV
jgi:glycine betaine catabolism B